MPKRDKIMIVRINKCIIKFRKHIGDENGERLTHSAVYNQFKITKNCSNIEM